LSGEGTLRAVKEENHQESEKSESIGHPTIDYFNDWIF
jgi:hypothetical protein